MQGPRHSPADEDDGSVRLDKWLWAARFYKTRSLATAAVDAGHVRLNEQRCKPARTVKAGDQIKLVRGGEELEVCVLAISSVRGPAPLAQQLYEESTASMQRRIEAAKLRKLTPETIEGGGRPTKRARRELERWRSER